MPVLSDRAEHHRHGRRGPPLAVREFAREYDDGSTECHPHRLHRHPGRKRRPLDALAFGDYVSIYRIARPGRPRDRPYLLRVAAVPLDVDDPEQLDEVEQALEAGGPGGGQQARSAAEAKLESWSEPERLRPLPKTSHEHFAERSESLDGKAMVVGYPAIAAKLTDLPASALRRRRPSTASISA